MPIGERAFDEDKPCEEGPALLKRSRTARPDIAIGVVLAKCEYEAWFLAAAESLRGTDRLRSDLTSPSDPEGVTGAKGWLSRNMRGSSYRPTADHAGLTRDFDLDQAWARSPSFDKCHREVTRLLTELHEKAKEQSPPSA
ncbi:MAG: DUF4276 family protein [Planctomycetes bacterium]|nr:DUF4276 family protein [Planctomycetota bacterium]MBI3846715.1 DUF4276 family protein [Planctomycetota bacterium]